MPAQIGAFRLTVGLAFALSMAAANAQVSPGSAEADTDWQTRASATGVFYNNNFSSYGDSQALRDAANTLTHIAGQKEVSLDSVRTVSGGGSVRIRTFSSVAKNGGTWGDQYKNGEKVNDFYFQVALYLPRETLGWRSLGGDGQLKLVNLERYGGGQVVIFHNKGLGFPSVLTNGAGVMQRLVNDTPYSGSGDYFYQNAIDSGSSVGAGDREAYWRRYGPSRQARAAFDYSYVANNASANLLYNRGFQWPNADAIASGAVPYNLDGWTVVEVYVSTKNGGPQRLKMWAAAYGEAPRLIVDTDAADADSSEFPKFASDVYSRFELLNYETPRQSETGYRPILDTYFDEVIASSNPIPFPGGFALDGTGGTPGGGGGGSGGGGSGGSGGPNVNLALSAAPSWVLDIPPGTWAAIGQNSLSDVDPEDDASANPNFPNSAPWRGTTGQKALTQSWNGGTFASGFGRHGSLILYGGGHANYYGSEIYAFDMETQTWNRLTDPYPGPFNWPYSTGSYPDGSPVPPHTYGFSSYDAETNSYVLLYGVTTLGTNASREFKIDLAHMFSFDTMSWRRSDHAPSPAPNLQSGGWSVYDSRRGLHWGEGGTTSDRMAAFDATTNNGDGTFGRWVGAYSIKTAATDTVAEYDPRNDIVVILPWRNDDRVAGIDLSDPDAKEVYLNVTGSAPSTQAKTGIAWSKSNQAFLQLGNGGAGAEKVYQLRHVSGDWKTGPWKWDQLTSVGNNVVPEDATNGVYDRFQVVTYSDAEVAVVVKSAGGAVYAFRVPEAISPNPNTNMSAQ